MKRIAVLVAGAFLLQQFAPTMLWATDLATAIASPSVASYELTTNETVTEDLPAYGGSKFVFSVNGANHTLTGNEGVNGFQVGSMQTLNLTDITLDGFVNSDWDGSEPPTNFAVINNGTLNLNGIVTNNSVIGYTGVTEEAAPQGTVNINGTLTNTGAIAQKDVVVAQSGTLNTNFDNLILASLTNNGTINVSGGETGEFTFTGDGTLNVQGDFIARDSFSQGTINVEQGNLFRLDAADGGAPIAVTAGTVTNAGTVVLGQANDTLTAALTNNGTVQLRNDTVLTAQGGSNGSTATIGGNGTGEYGNLVVQGAYDINGETPLAFVNNNNTAGAITVNALTIAGATANTPAGQFTTNLDAIVLHDGNNPWITNNGVLNLTGGTNEYEIKGDGNGIVNIVSGTVINGGDSKGAFTNQRELNIYQGATFNNANADAMTFGSLTNSGTLLNANRLTVTDGSNASGATISGAGELFVNGAFANQNATAGAITQNVLTVGTDGQLTTNAGALNVTGHFINDGTVVLTGGTNNNLIKDSTVHANFSAAPTAGTTQITGNVLNTSEIHQQHIEIAATGQLTTAANALKTSDNSVKNLGTLVFVSEDNSNAIDGTYTVTDEFTNQETTALAGTVIFKDAAHTNSNTVNQANIQIGTATDEETFTFQNYADAMTGKLVNYGTLNTSTGQIRILGTQENPSYNYGTIIGNDGPVSPSGISHISLESGAYLVNAGTIDAMRIHSNATLETAAGDVGDIYNHGTVLLDSGTNTGIISYKKSDIVDYSNTEDPEPAGTVIVRGDVINSALIKQEQITIEDGASLQSAAHKVDADITNNGTFTLIGNSGSDSLNNNEEVDHTLDGTGTLIIDGEEDTHVRINNTSFAQGNVTIAQGNTFTTYNTAVTVSSEDVKNPGTMTVNGTYGLLSGQANIDKLVNNHSVLNAGELTIAGTQADPSINAGSIGYYEGNTPSGTLNVAGYLDNTSGTIEQNDIQVTGTLVTAAGNVSAAHSFKNDGTIAFTAGNISQTITNTANDTSAGSILISGTNMALENAASLKQNELTVAENAQLTAKAGSVTVQNLTNDGTLTANLNNLTIGGDFVNNAALTLTGGQLANAITGNNGTLTVSDGSVQITDGSINQQSVIIASATQGENPLAQGQLSAKTGQITSASGLENHGQFTFTGALEDAANTLAITGNDGSLVIAADITNQANITQQSVSVNEDVFFTHNGGTLTAGVAVAEGAQFTNNSTVISALTNDGTFVNNATLKLADGEASENNGHIIGNGDTIVLDGADFANNSTFSQKSLTINEGGVFQTNFDHLTLTDDSITNNGELDLLGGTIHKDIVKGEGTTGDVGIGGEILLQEGTKINQHNLLVANMPDDGIVGSLTANASDITLSGTLTNDNELTFTGGQNANAIAGTGNVMIGGDATNVEVTNLAGTQIANTVAITQGNHLLAQAGDLTKTVSNAGQLTLSGTDVTNVAQITGNGELVIDGTITNTDEKTIANTITINANKSLQANAADVLNNVTNEGTFKISGGNVAVTVANAAADTLTGTVEITGTDVRITDGSITQNKLTIANTGSFAANMQDGKLTVAAIENNGTFDVTGDLNTAISGTGTLNITDSLENKTNVSQKIITIASGQTFTTAAGDVTATQGITNNGTLSFTGGTNTNNITGGLVEIAGSVINTTGNTINSALSIGEGAGLQANANDITSNVTNDGTYTVTGGTIGADVLNQAHDTSAGEVIIAGEGVLLGASLHQNKLTIASGDFAADMLDIEVETLTNNGTFHVSGDIDTDISGQGNLAITTDLQNTAHISQNTVTVQDGVNFTTDAALVTAGLDNQAGTLTFTGGQNVNAITGAGTLEIAGDVTNTASIQNDITVNNSQSLTAYADHLLGNVTNNGTVRLTGGTLNQSLTGNTELIGNVALGANATSFDSLTVAAGNTWALNDVHVTVDNATINGTLNMNVDNIANESTGYDGGKLIATNGVTLGATSKLTLTFGNNGLATGQQTGELELIEGDVTGNWASALSANNRYKVQAVAADQGKVVVSYTTSAGEVAQEAGANGNEVAAAGAWDKEPTSNPTAAALNYLSQNDAAGYVEALEDLAPVQVPMVKSNVSSLNQSIYTAANNHMQYGGNGLAAGDMFAYKSVWMQGLYNKAKNNVHGGFEGDTYGGAVGMDISNGEYATIGLGYAYAYSKLKAEGKKTNADSQNIFLYGNYTGLEDWYFDGTLGYNFGKYKETKNVFGVGTGKGNYHVNSLAAQAMAQYYLNEYITPLAGIRYIYAHQGAYNDGLGQHIYSASDHTLTALLGAKTGRNFQAGKLVLKPEVKVAALFDVLQHGDHIAVSTGSNSYSVKSEQLKKFGVEAGAGVGIDLTDQLELSLGYDGQFRSHYYNHTGSAKLKYSF